MTTVVRTILASAIWTVAALCWALASAAGGTAGEVAVATVAPATTIMPVQAAADIRFRRTRLEEGLSQTRVAQIVQDDRGFMWFGTQHGLNRFDGREYRLFKHERGQPGSLSGVFVYALFKARDGALWVGTDQGLDVYDAATETFRHIQLEPDTASINDISQDEAGILWLASVQGLYRLDPTTGEARRYLHDPADPASLGSNDVKSTGLDRQGRFWVATGEGLEAFDRTSGRVELRIPIKENVREFYFHEDRTGTFWIVYGSGNGLAQYDRATNTLTRIVIQGGSSGGDGLTGVYAILEDRDGTIWLGTMGEGLLRYDRESRSFTAYRHDPARIDSLAENRVIALFEDSQRNIWVGLHASPPNMFPADKPAFTRISTPAFDPKAAGETLVDAVFTDSSGILWVGAGGALGRIDRRAGDSRTIPLSDGAVEVLAIAEHPRGTLWVGTLGNGLYRLDLETGERRSYRTVADDPRSIGSDIVTRIVVDRAGRMWIATWNGLNLFDPKTGEATRYKRNPQRAAETYFSIAEDTAGDLWLGSTAGLFRFTPATGTFRGYRSDPDRAGSLSDNTVDTILIDDKGALWVGTHNGLNRFDPKTETFRTIGKRDGLPGDVVSCILEERPGVLWMSTNNGIARFDTASEKVSSYSIADGLPGNDLSGWDACHRAASGEMVFGGFAGATAFRPEGLADSADDPPVRITEVAIAGSPATARRPPRATTDATPFVEIPSDRNAFSIAYAAMCFRNPEAVRYRYRLAGLDGGWNEVDAGRRVAGYTAVPSGTYRFEVQARTGRSDWSEPGEALTVRVLPPWWERWWVKAGGLALLAAACLAVYRTRLAQIDQRYAIRLEERVLERTRIARDIHDSLLQGYQGLVLRLQAVRNILPGRPAEAAEMLDAAMDRADAAIEEGRNKVSELRSVAGGDLGLPEALATLRDEAGPAGAGFEVMVEGRVRPIGPWARDEIFQIAREAVRNAARHARPSRIELELAFGRKALILRIRDNGAGMDKATLSGGRPGGWGLTGMRERTELIRGELTVWSHPGAGTEIEVSIPAAVAYARSGEAAPSGSPRDPSRKDLP